MDENQSSVKGVNIDRIVLETQKYYDNMTKKLDFCHEWGIGGQISLKTGLDGKEKGLGGRLRLYIADKTLH